LRGNVAIYYIHTAMGVTGVSAPKNILSPQGFGDFVHVFSQ